RFSEDHRVDQAERGGVDADAQAERNDCDHGETDPRAKPAEGILQVANESAHRSLRRQVGGATRPVRPLLRNGKGSVSRPAVFLWGGRPLIAGVTMLRVPTVLTKACVSPRK